TKKSYLNFFSILFNFQIICVLCTITSKKNIESLWSHLLALLSKLMYEID
ncbi:hypothetical protein AAJ76_3270001864, partial [Vairimorpha ceranae]